MFQFIAALAAVTSLNVVSLVNAHEKEISRGDKVKFHGLVTVDHEVSYLPVLRYQDGKGRKIEDASWEKPFCEVRAYRYAPDLEAVTFLVQEFIVRDVDPMQWWKDHGYFSLILDEVVPENRSVIHVEILCYYVNKKSTPHRVVFKTLGKHISLENHAEP